MSLFATQKSSTSGIVKRHLDEKEGNSNLFRTLVHEIHVP